MMHEMKSFYFYFSSFPFIHFSPQFLHSFLTLLVYGFDLVKIQCNSKEGALGKSDLQTDTPRGWNFYQQEKARRLVSFTFNVMEQSIHK